jgi:hypothetical protein
MRPGRRHQWFAGINYGDNSSQLRDLVPIDISGDLSHLFNLQGEAVSKTRRHHLTVSK